MVHQLSVAVLAAVSACAQGEKQEAAPPARITVADTGLKTPESVLYDAAGDVYLVSNINGGPLEKDNNGFISRVSPGGQMVALRWIAGGSNGVTLNAPKGMAVKADTLFVADIDAVRVFDRATGAPLGSREIRGATFLNDMAVGPDGTVYVTDSGLRSGPGGFAESGTDAVYRFDADGKAAAVAKGPGLGRPNGIAVDSTGITVVTFGSGEAYRIDPASGTRSDLPKPPKGQLDGIEKLADGSLLVSSWEGQAVYRLSGATYTTAADSVPSPADIGFDPERNALLIPIFTGNKIEIRVLK